MLQYKGYPVTLLYAYTFYDNCIIGNMLLYLIIDKMFVISVSKIIHELIRTFQPNCPN